MHSCLVLRHSLLAYYPSDTQMKHSLSNHHFTDIPMTSLLKVAVFVTAIHYSLC